MVESKVSINIDFLYYLIAFKETGSLSKASERVLVSQSALTRAMQRLEDYVGVPLFKRSGNRMELNENGEIFYQGAVTVVNALEVSREKVRSTASGNGRISIGLVGPGPLYPTLSLFQNSFPTNEISTKIESEEEVVEGLRIGRFDLGFILGQGHPELVYGPMLTERIEVSIPLDHPLSTHTEGVGWDVLDGESFFLNTEIGTWEEVLKKRLPHSHIYRQNYLDGSDLIDARKIPGFLTNLTYRKDVNRVRIPIVADDAEIRYRLVYKAENERRICPFLHAYQASFPSL